ncbi:hypothetical protein BD779DRAFT_1560062 [Infundibulicybe gibba]|nr:hypothetical protein BD779DRAFT_1560062 [Infundibulicybe gibba]
MLNVAVMTGQDQNGGRIGLSSDDAWTMSPSQAQSQVRLFEAHIGTRKPRDEIFNFLVASTHEQCSNEHIVPTLGIVAIPLALEVHLLSRNPRLTSSNWLDTFRSSLTSHIPNSRSSPGSFKGPSCFYRVRVMGGGSSYQARCTTLGPSPHPPARAIPA